MAGSLWKSFVNILLAREISDAQPSKKYKEEIFEYPARPKGTPVIAPKTIMENHKEVIQRIIEQAVTSEEITEKFYLPIIERFASFVQLLPASQTHHHHDAGGLFRHSLEVGYRALQLADRVLVGGTRTPRQRRDLQPRWQFAVFAAALCHDGGKPMYDMTVSNYERTLSWKPIAEDLYVWATRNQLNGYHIDWREGRGRQHTALAILLMDRIITREALEWLELSGMDLVTWLTESLNYNPSATNLIHELVIKADQFSVERNLKSIGATLVAHDQFNAPTERYLVEIMKSLIREGMWRINEPGARIWKIGEHVYIVWPLGGDEMSQHARLDNVPMVPRTPDGIMEFLVEREIAIVRDENQYLWEIVPDCIAEKLPNKSLFAIRLRSDSLITTLPIQSVPGKLLNDPRQSKATGATYDKVVTASTSSIIPHGNENTDADKPAPSASAESKLKPTNSTGQPTLTELPAENAGTNEAYDGAVTGGHPAKHSDKPKNGAIELDGAEGEVLKAIAQDIADGVRRWGQDAFVDGGNVLLSWPDALDGYGISSSTILIELSEKQLLHTDPLKPMKRTLEFRVKDKEIKVVKLEQNVSHAFLLITESAPELGPVAKSGKTLVSPLPVADERPVAQLNLPKAKKAKAKQSGGNSDEAMRTPKTTPIQTTIAQPTVEEIVGLLEKINADNPDQDGWHRIANSVINRHCRNSEFKITDIQKLAKNNPDKLQAEKFAIKYKK